MVLDMAHDLTPVVKNPRGDGNNVELDRPRNKDYEDVALKPNNAG